MRLEKAYSEDVQKNITATRADELYLDGQISSKYHFQCPDQRCSAPVTCANLDKPEHRRKRDPYYKVVAEHDIGCDIGAEEKKIRDKYSTYNDIYSDTDEYFDHAVRLNLLTASGRRPSYSKENEDEGEGIERNRPSEYGEGGKRKIQRSKTLGSLIDAFMANENITVQLPDVDLIHINDLFVEINGQSISEFDDEFRIYYGRGWINKLDDDKGFAFKFANKLRHQEDLLITSAYMPLWKMEIGNFKRFRLPELESVSDNSLKMLFLLSDTAPYHRNVFINIWCDGPEYRLCEYSNH